MVTFINRGKINVYYGLSTDTKPVNPPNASIFYEIDTVDIYMYDADNSQWRKQ